MINQETPGFIERTPGCIERTLYIIMLTLKWNETDKIASKTPVVINVFQT